MSVLICFLLLAASQQKAPNYLTSAAAKFELSKSDLPGFQRSGEPRIFIELGPDKSNMGRYSAVYSTPMTKDGREAVFLDVQILNDARTGKKALSWRRQVYQAPCPRGSLTGMQYADEVDHQIAKNVLGVVALKGRFLIDITLTFGDPIDKRKSVVDVRMNARKLLVDQIAAKILARAAAQTWPDLGKHK